MADLLDLDKARERKSHLLREARVRKLRKAFKEAREAWSGADGKTNRNAGKLKDLFKKKRNGRKK